MRNTVMLVVLMVALVIVGSAMWRPTNTQAQQRAQPRLPGARAVIEASDYPSLQAAFDAVPEQGGVVRIPPGVFEIESSLFVRTEDTTIEGSGSATHIKNVNADGQPALVLRKPDTPGTHGTPGTPGTPKTPGNKRLWRIRLSNFRITGNEQSGPGILADRINEVFIQGVTVSYHGGDGIVLDHCYEDPRVSDCLITYNKGTGLNLPGCHDIVVSANQFEENVDAVRCTDAYNLCMTGNCLDDHLGRGVVIENTYGSVVSGNMIEECKSFAIVLDRDCYGNTISANVIAHNGGGVDLRDAHGCAVSANTFTIMGDHAVRIGPNSGRITLTGNNFSNSYIGDGKVKRGENDRKAFGIQLHATRDVAVTGNLFSSVQPKAIEFKGDASKHILVTGNVFTDVESDQTPMEDSMMEVNLTAPAESSSQ